MQYTPNFEDYKSYPETDSCYLDGRFIEKSLVNYPGLLSNPMHIQIREVKSKSTGKKTKSHKSEQRSIVSMKENHANPNFPGLLRVIIQTPTSKHSNLLILDYENGIAHRFEPLGKRGPHFEAINQVIEEYLSYYGDFEVANINTAPLEEINPKCARKKQRSGFCNAYVLMYAYNFLNRQEFDPSHILRFAKKVETEMGTLPREGADIEWGLFGNDNPNQGRNALLGASVGGIGGAVLTGTPGGALIGGLGGAFIGSII